MVLLVPTGPVLASAKIKLSSQACMLRLWVKEQIYTSTGALNGVIVTLGKKANDFMLHWPQSLSISAKKNENIDFTNKIVKKINI